MNKKVMVVIGKACSGKDYYAERMLDIDDKYIVKASDLVKKIIKRNVEIKNESQLDNVNIYEHSSVELWEEIVQEFNKIVEENDEEGLTFVLTGIRESKILDELMKKYDDIGIILLNVTLDLRVKFYGISRNKENLSDVEITKHLIFRDVKDNFIGLGELIQHIHNLESKYKKIVQYDYQYYTVFNDTLEINFYEKI